MYRILTLVVCVIFTHTTFSQNKWVETDIFTRYSEDLQQPLRLSYKVECPNGDAFQSGIQWFGTNGEHLISMTTKITSGQGTPDPSRI